MVDILALALSHGLLALAVLRLMYRDDLDREGDDRARHGRRGAPRTMNLPGRPAGDGEAGADA